MSEKGWKKDDFSRLKNGYLIYSAPFFNEWIEYSNEIIEYGRCAGYKIPLFLGGENG